MVGLRCNYLKYKKTKVISFKFEILNCIYYLLLLGDSNAGSNDNSSNKSYRNYR